MQRTKMFAVFFLMILIPLSGYGFEEEVILHIDFEDGKLPTEYNWSDAKITSSQAIDGDYSMIEAGSYPEMWPLPIDSVTQYRLEFDYRIKVTEEDHQMDFRIAADRGWYEGQTNPRLVRQRLDGPAGHASFTFRSIWPQETVFTLQFFHGNNTTIDNIKLTKIINPHVEIAAPELLIPFSKQEVSPVAATWFTWAFDNDYRDFLIAQEIQWADNPEFHDPYTRIEPHLGEEPNWTPFIKLREKNTELRNFLSEPGKKYWRVRGINEYDEPGKWSNIDSFQIVQPKKKVEPEWDLSQKPLFGQYVAGAYKEELKEQWETIPDEVKPYWAFQWSPHERNYERIWLEGTGSAFIDMLEFCEKEGIPLILRMPEQSTAVEWAYQNYDCVKGVEIKESREKLEADRGKDRIANNLKMAAQYGKFVLDMEMCWPLYAFATIGTDQDLMSTIKNYSEYYIASDKKSAQFKTIRAVTTIMGFWLGDMAGSWGMNVEDWYWYDRDGAGEGNILPQLATLVTSGGGKVLTTQSTTAYSSFDHVEEDYWRQKIWYPLLQELVNYHYTPSKEEVKSEIHVAAQLQKSDVWYDQFNFNSFKGLFEAIYGPIRHPYESMPNKNRYYLMPIFPKYGVDFSHMNDYQEIIYSTEFTNEDTTLALFNKYYEQPTDYEGDAYIAHVGKSWFVTPTTEGEFRGGWNNRNVYGDYEKVQNPDDRTESYSLNIQHDGIERMYGTVNPYQYLMIREMENGLRIHQGNKREWITTLQFEAESEPGVSIHPSEAAQDISWDADDGVLTVKTNHEHGAVNVEIGNGGELNDQVTETESEATPMEFALQQNYPNPFNPSTTIPYQLKEQSAVTMKVYDTQGELVITLVSKMQSPGYYQVQWDGKNRYGEQVSSGVYLYRIEANPVSEVTQRFQKTHKLIIVR